MKLSDLHIHNLRNIQNRQTALHASLNFIQGINGSGKTSFLEALYLLATGRSFRSREVSQLISQGETQLNIFAKTQDLQTLSLQKSLQHPMIAQINGNPCAATSELAHFLPCQLLYQDIFQIIDAGPGLRRGVLDWGLFHVEHDYHLILKDYRRALQQRNVLLKQNVPIQQFLSWNHLLSKLATDLHERRIQYFNNLYPRFLEVLRIISNLDCKITYFKGWDRKNEGKNLEQILELSHQSDRQRQFTQYGAHQADLMIETEDRKAKHFFSRGQQKIFLFALKFAQISLLPKTAIILIDDLMSELDKQHIDKVLNYIDSMEGQFFVTCQPEDLPKNNQGVVISMTSMHP